MIQDSVNKVIYEGNGQATQFFYPFVITKNTDVKVMTVSPDGAETVLTNDYYVDVEKNIVLYPGWAEGEEPENIEEYLPLGDGWRLVVYREVPFTQEVAMFDQYPFKVLEGMIDKNTILAQQLKDETDRAMRLSVSVDNSDISLIVPNGKGTSFRWSDDGKRLEVTDDPAKVKAAVDKIAAEVQQNRVRAEEGAATATVKASEASTSAANAKISENSASASASSASASESNAKSYMDTTNGYMEQAGASASSASTSANNAKISETNASISASSAYTSASNAGISATNASESETSAKTSAEKAKDSEDNAKRYAEEAFINAEQNKSDKLPIGHEWWTANPNIPVGCLPLFGGTFSREAYKDLWAWVQTQGRYLISESEWQEKATANEGNVPFYSTGDGSTTFRVPSLKCHVQGANGVEEVGSYLKAGLPNITGSFNFTNDSGVATGFSTSSTAEGAFGKIAGGNGKIVSMANSEGERDTEYNIDASRCSSIYGNSDTVQPPSIVGMWLVKAFGTVSNIGNQDIADVSAGLARVEVKMDEYTDNVAYIDSFIVESWKSDDGMTWYRKYSDGFIEQGGAISCGTGYQSVTVTLPTAFTTTTYTAMSAAANTSKIGDGIDLISGKSTTAFTTHTHYKGDTLPTWYACGY